MKALFIILVFFIFGCAATSPTLQVSSPGSKERALYDQGLRTLSRSDFKGASSAFSDLLRLYPSTKWVSGAYYNLGLALEGQNDFRGAIDKYQKVIELNESNSPSRDQADALYRLSICYELLGNDEKMTLTLLQLLDNKKFLPRQIVEMEIPARLAASYARQGNPGPAKKYYEKAEQGLRKYRRPPLNGDVMAWLPKTLFSMGQMPQIKKDVTLKDFEDYLSTVTQTQGWLVRAGELGNNPWSRKACDNLEDIYLSLLVSIRDFKVADNSDRLLALKQRQEIQKKMALELDGAIGKLKLERLPASPAEPEAGRLTDTFKTVANVESRVSDIVQAHDVQDQDTPEAQAIQGLKR